jgi:hypothetical protein
MIHYEYRKTVYRNEKTRLLIRRFNNLFLGFRAFGLGLKNIKIFHHFERFQLLLAIFWVGC